MFVSVIFRADWFEWNSTTHLFPSRASFGGPDVNVEEVAPWKNRPEDKILNALNNLLALCWMYSVARLTLVPLDLAIEDSCVVLIRQEPFSKLMRRLCPEHWSNSSVRFVIDHRPHARPMPVTPLMRQEEAVAVVEVDRQLRHQHSQPVDLVNPTWDLWYDTAWHRRVVQSTLLSTVSPIRHEQDLSLWILSELDWHRIVRHRTFLWYVEPVLVRQESNPTPEYLPIWPTDD